MYLAELVCRYGRLVMNWDKDGYFVDNLLTQESFWFTTEEEANKCALEYINGGCEVCWGQWDGKNRKRL